MNPGFDVYVKPEDFERHYPWFPKWGYSTAYECMGLLGDRRVPAEAKWGFWANHMNNMRWAFRPPPHYTTLLEIVSDKDYFVYTSNVDACFARAGFDAESIYTPQGEWTYYQCMAPCRSDSVFESRPMLDQVLPLVSDEGILPRNKVPVCPNCGGPVFGNVRGGDWFIHEKFDDANRKFVQWVQDVVVSKRRLVVIEIGAGFNTPTVTRFPMEAIVRELSDAGAALVRLNPSDAEVPGDLPSAVGISSGCEALVSIQAQLDQPDGSSAAAAEGRIAAKRQLKHTAPGRCSSAAFNWRSMMQNLRR